MKIVIWLDDQRDPNGYFWKRYIQERLAVQTNMFETTEPHTYKLVWITSADQFKEIFGFYSQSTTDEIYAVFFDYQLSYQSTSLTGWDAFRWMYQQIQNQNLPEFKTFTQSTHPEGKAKILRGITKLENHWYKNLD